MGNSINRVEILGRVGDKPKAFGKDGDMCSFSVATSEQWKDKDGNKQERTEWHSVTVFNKGLAGVCLSYLEKGSRVYLSGQLQTSKYTDKDGVERHETRVVIPTFGGNVVIIDFQNDEKGNKKENKSNRRRTEDETYNDIQKQKQSDKSGWDSVPPQQDFDDDLPF